jgi:hypothetical protein
MLKAEKVQQRYRGSVQSNTTTNHNCLLKLFPEGIRAVKKAFKFSSEEAGALAVKKAMEGIRKVSAAEPHDRCEDEKEIRMSLQRTILVCLHRQRNCPNRSETIDQLRQ